MKDESKPTPAKVDSTEKSGAKTDGHKAKIAKHATIFAQTVGLKTHKEIMIAAGYAPSTASDQPKRTRLGKNFRQLLDEIMPEEDIVKQHEALLKSRKLDHMVFPTKLEDEEIAELLASANCILRKVVHSEQAKHAYFWSPDNRARKDALDMLYKIKGNYAPEKFEDVSPYKNLSTEELLERKKAAIAFFKKKNAS